MVGSRNRRNTQVKRGSGDENFVRKFLPAAADRRQTIPEASGVGSTDPGRSQCLAAGAKNPLPRRTHLEHKANMWDAQDTAYALQQRLQQTRRHRRASQREDLFHAARILIPEHGIAIALARIAVHAGLSRHAAAALFNATSDLATELVRRAWHALIEATAPTADTTPAQFLAGLIRALRDDPAVHRIHQTLACGTPAWQRTTIAEAETLLARGVAQGLRDTWPDRGADIGETLGRRVLVLLRDAAFAPHAPNPDAEAALITAVAAATLAYDSPNTAAPARLPPTLRPPAPVAPVAPVAGSAARIAAAGLPPQTVHDPPTA
jgi:hypothetical protein